MCNEPFRVKINIILNFFFDFRGVVDFKMLKRKLSVKTLNEKQLKTSSVKQLKTSRKAYLIKTLPKSMKSHPIQFHLVSKIKRSVSKLWKTIVPAKNEN